MSLIISTSASAQKQILYLNFEADSKDLNTRNKKKEGPKADDATVLDCTNARKGSCSLRTTVQNSDDYISFGNHRAESNIISLMPSRYSAGDHFRYKFSLYLPQNWEIDSRESIDIVWQFKRFNSPPDAFIAIKGKDIVLRKTGSGTKEEQATLLTKYSVGQWIDITMDIKWAVDETGKFETTVELPSHPRSKHIVTISGPNTSSSKAEPLPTN